MIDLSRSQWIRLYKEVSLFAQRRTYTKVEKRRWNARDRAQEAVQRACERLLTQKPAKLTTFEAVRIYLFAAVRSELSHAGERAEMRKDTEGLAASEQAALSGDAALSAEAMQLEKAIALRDQRKAARILELTSEELEGDRIALGTITCMANEQMTPAEQAAVLECDVDEIYLARTRRVRAVGRALARFEKEHKPESEEAP